MITLPERWSKFLLTQPETGMGYQVVAITLRDGRIIQDVAIVDHSVLAAVRGRPHISFDPAQSHTLQSRTGNGIFGAKAREAMALPSNSFSLDPMTIREHLTRKKRKSMIIFLVGFVVFGCSATAVLERYRIILAAVGMAIMLSDLFYAAAVRCPNCRNSLAAIFSSSAWSVDKSAQVCPSCCIELDSPMPPKPV